MRKILILLALAILSASPGLSEAATYYIRSGAAGNKSGMDWVNALPQLPATLARGNTYFIADGTYPGYTFDDPQNGAWIYIKKATPASHGTSAGWQNAYGDGKAVFGPLKFSTGYYEVDGQTGGGPGKWTSGHGIKVEFAQSANTVKLINVTKNVPFLTFKHMELAFKPCSSCRGQDAVYAIKGGRDWKFQYMWIHHPSRVVFYTMGNANKILVEYSLLERSGTNGSSSQHSEIWSTNFGPTANNGAVGSWSSDPTYYASNIKVHNNSFVGLRNGGAGKIFPVYRSISGVSAYNNLWYNSPASGFGGGVSHSNNWFKDSNEAKIAEPSKEVGTSDPFRNAAAGDFRLRGATRSGTSLGSPFNIDAAGLTRGRDGIWDKGAYEFKR